jgi:uncharacterized protein YndB with AHSA1/START domain
MEEDAATSSVQEGARMSKRVQAAWTVSSSKSPQAVFDYLSDFNRHHEWSPKPLRIEGAPAGPATKGATFTSYGWIPGDKEHRNDVEVTEVSPPSRIAWVARERGEEFINTFVLTPEGPGTRIERQMDSPKPTGFVGVLFPVIMKMVVKPGVQKGMNQLAQRLETV